MEKISNVTSSSAELQTNAVTQGIRRALGIETNDWSRRIYVMGSLSDFPREEIDDYRVKVWILKEGHTKRLAASATPHSMGLYTLNFPLFLHRGEEDSKLLIQFCKGRKSITEHEVNAPPKGQNLIRVNMDG